MKIGIISDTHDKLKRTAYAVRLLPGWLWLAALVYLALKLA